MVDWLGRWSYDINTPEGKKCDYDRLADEIVEYRYEPEYGIENLVLMIYAHFDRNDEYIREAYPDTTEGVLDFVFDSGGFKEFDYEP